jgi:hypothetical protein
LNSETTNALSAFSETALALYKERGLKIPDNIQLLKEVRALPAKKPEFIPIDPDTDALMIRLANAALDKRAFGALTDAERRNVPSAQIATVFELARFCSLTCKVGLAGVRRHNNPSLRRQRIQHKMERKR